MTDWHATQNEEYLNLIKTRLNQPKLKWVDQFVDIINYFFKDNIKEKIIINDIGCNVGHFYRGITDIKISKNIVYNGYDISKTYIDIAKKHFSSDAFEILDISKEAPKECNISVISATLEHIPDSNVAMDNLFNSTTDIILLRTFLGESELNDECQKSDSQESYIIKQFVLENLLRIAGDKWSYFQIDDIATSGCYKKVCETKDIFRKQSIILFMNKSK